MEQDRRIAAAVHRAGKTKMDVEERKLVEENLRDLKEQLKKKDPENATAANPSLIQDTMAITHQIKRLEELLNMDDDLIAKGEDRKKLDGRRKELEAILKKEMPTAREQALPGTSGNDFERAVQKTMHHQKKYGPMIMEWQEIMKRLDPENPEACDTRKLIP